jgi:hypothetical protein
MTEDAIQVEARRPLGVLVVAIIQFVRATLLVGQLLGVRIGVDWLRIAAQVPEPTPDTVAYWMSRGLAIALVVATLAVGYGLLAERRWGWVGAIILSGLSLAFAIGAWWDGHATYVSMLINVVAVFYLNQRDVRAVYEVPDAAETVDHVTETPS